MENEYGEHLECFLNVIQRLRLKSDFRYTKNVTLFDHVGTYKLGHVPRTNTNHVHIFRPCKKHLQSLKKNPYKTVGGVAHTGQAVRCSTIAVSLTMSTSKKDIALCPCRGLFHKALYTSQLESPHVVL